MTGRTAAILNAETWDIETEAEAPQHVDCGLTMVGPMGPVPCTCHRSCDPVTCPIAASGYALYEDMSL
jgi:hypothetical protein